MSEGLCLPASAYVDIFVAKGKFYEHANLNSRTKKEIFGKIQRITWKYKLAEDTIGIAKTDKVTEIQIFELELKTQEIPLKALKIIDKTIPYQILYKFVFRESVAWGITLKEGYKAQNYYFSEWDEPITFDFTGIDLQKVYQKLVKAFIGAVDNKKNFTDLVANDTARKQLENEIRVLERKMKKEKQFNRKVDMNKILLEKKQQLGKLSEP